MWFPTYLPWFYPLLVPCSICYCNSIVCCQIGHKSSMLLELNFPFIFKWTWNARLFSEGKKKIPWGWMGTGGTNENSCFLNYEFCVCMCFCVHEWVYVQVWTCVCMCLGLQILPSSVYWKGPVVKTSWEQWVCLLPQSWSLILKGIRILRKQESSEERLIGWVQEKPRILCCVRKKVLQNIMRACHKETGASLKGLANLGHFERPRIKYSNEL